MRYLIDGHNLIAKLPDISLSDPDDEVKLVLRLRSWTAADRRRKVTIVFDTGLPGGRDRVLSSSTVQVIFASSGSSADAVILRHIDRVKDVKAVAVVSSDREVTQAALRRRIAVFSSDEFAAQLVPRRAQEPADADRSAADSPPLSAVEVDEWLALFGDSDSIQPD